MGFWNNKGNMGSWTGFFIIPIILLKQICYCW